MKQIKIDSWLIEIDVTKTKEFYEKHHFISEDCACDYCANYILACDTFSPEVRDLFHALGIDPRKEGEVSEFMKNEDGTHVYGAFYHLVGRIIEGPRILETAKQESEISPLIFVNYHGIEISFTEDLSLVPEGFPTPTIQLELQLTIPWLLKT